MIYDIFIVMNKDYLDRVVNILVSETTINDDIVSTPFSSHFSSFFLTLPSPLLLLTPTLSPIYFSEFVIDYYGLTEEETEYVWKQYRSIINNKIDEQ